MKFHLPKKLLAAIMAAMMSYSLATGAVMVATPSHIENVNEDVSVTELPEALSEEGGGMKKPYIKDGDAKLTVTGVAGEVTSALFVREGTMVIKDSLIYARPADGDGCGSIVQVSGNNPELVLDNTVYLNPYAYLDKVEDGNGGYIAVSGADGKGTLTLKNNSRLSSRYSMLAGYHSEGYWYDGLYIPCATKETTSDSSNRYGGGVYDSVIESTGLKYGKATINVESGSSLELGTIFQLGEAVMNITGAGSQVKTGTISPNYVIVLGRQTDCTSELNVTNGGKLLANSWMRTGYNGVLGTSVTINVDGKDSAIMLWGIQLGHSSASDSKTLINITNGGLFQFAGGYLNVEDGKNAVEVNIGKDSSFVSTEGDFSIRQNCEVNNAGLLSACVLRVEKGSVLNIDNGTGTLELGSLITSDGSKLTIDELENGQDAVITIGDSWNIAENSVFEFSLADTYARDDLKAAVATYTGNKDNWVVQEGTSILKLNSLLWSASNLSWTVEGDTAYVTGSLVKNEKVEIEDGADVDTPITDTEDKKVVVVVTGDATISGDNTHTGGTIVDEANLTLGSDSALGAGGIETTGESSITSEAGVVVILPDTVTNKGELTISGSYDGSKLSAIATTDTRVCVDGKDGNNGFFREGGTALVVVDNKGNATLTVDGNTVVLKGDQSLKLDASGLATEKGLDYSNYHIEDSGHEASMSEIQAMRPDQDAALTISMNGGTLVADADVTDVKATAGTIETKGDVAVGGKLAGTTSVAVGEGTTTLSGDNSYTGYTTISGENSKLIVGSDKALGASTVQLHNKGKLDLNGKAVGNYINVTGCELHNASAYTGSMDVSGNLTICGSNATADVVNMVKGGSIAASANESLTVNGVTVSGGDSTIDADLVINPDGSVVLNNGSKLNVKRSLTLGNGTTIVLNGGNYSKDDVILTSADTTAPAGGEVTLSYGRGTYVLNGNDIILTAVFNQNYADALTVSNWGIATASRAMVNAVRGQRSNTGCIADGKGTAWVASLGSKHDINGSDINISGAAVGADMQVGRNSRIGIALGYAEGEVQPSGLRQVDQEGSYIAAYGEHGLKKLSSTSCLSMDWVAAYGVTESEGAGQKWEQDSVQLNSRVNWNKKVTDKLCMSVFGGLEYFANNSDTVDGVKTGSIQNLRGEIGVGARYVAWGAPAATASYDEKGAMLTEARPGCEKLVLNGEIRYMNDMVRSNPVIRMEGLSGMGENPGRQGMGIEAGATYRIGERWSASANYGFNTMEDSKEHRVNVGAAYTF